mmetsp:Transcript_8442/g.27957  ORF Transcript_8442/g.27957 Transcript_8442/m.27957 type:complete len:229 (+) Transcript_8442:3058-3744(+)
MPPIVVKSPAAYRCPEVGSKAKLRTLAPKSRPRLNPTSSQLESRRDQPVPTLLKLYIATHPGAPVTFGCPPAYKTPRASSYAKARTSSFCSPDPIASHDEPVHLATPMTLSKSKYPATNISSPVAPATTAYTCPTEVSPSKGSETCSNSNAVALDKFDSHRFPEIAAISTSPASTNARGGTNPCATASSIAHAFLHPDIPRAHRQPLARLARVDAPNAPISRENNSST